MIRIGITGQSGFVGSHVFNTLKLFPDKYKCIPFEDSFFSNPEILKKFVAQCDVLIHLAALNRHNDPAVIYNTNISLVKQVIEACESTGSTPHILFSSSTQEERDNLYGKSKKEGRELFESWSDKTGGRFTGMVIPNVYGPFGNPYYNSVVATFCHQLTHNEIPKIEIDGEIKLIYIAELVNYFIQKIESVHENTLIGKERFEVPHTFTIKVSELLAKLSTYKEEYYKKGIIPDLSVPFDRNLFNTFLTYIDHKTFFPFQLNMNTDERGSFVETIKLSSGGQVSFSTTKPGITRGNHFHTRKAERFAVIRGKARIEIRRIGKSEKLIFDLDGEKPSFVDMPVWFTHNITNTGTEELLTIFWINEHFNNSDPDTYFEKV